ncbi:hemolysin family protein [Modestobacter sp. VKM Ac-2984]|uniref:hemolysin family protein n=1 Tax=Modestobacter sp. VKM Ac-2984 TaxID=3004138 RepID=UPI0022AA233C|nr:hemolysin family protein [Modestobacter sp. VKM Ac-2984]MCZ2817245.1 hemolysin family protein [Modestobacter sp. VKM Ac-2984]
MSDTVAILLAVFLLAGNAFFVGAEFALVSARRTQIEPRAAEGVRGARTTLRAIENVSLMMAGAQLGITVCSLGLGAVGEPAVAHLLEGPFAAAGLPEALVHPIAFAIALAVVVFLHMVLGEMVPKNISLAGPERAALLLGPLLYWVVRALHPLIWLLNQVANLVLRALRVTPQDEVSSTYTRDQVTGLIGESHREGLIDEREHQLLTGALQFDEQRTADVAIPTADLVTVPSGITVGELEEVCAATGYSRFPVVDGDGDLEGYVHLKDFLAVPVAERDSPVDPALIRPLAGATTDQGLRDVLATMQREGAHLAVVRDGDSGRAVGVVALEDVLEELVGEVRDAAQTVAAGRR